MADDMSNIKRYKEDNKQTKQRKTIQRYVSKLYKCDLQEVCQHFQLPKKGNKIDLQQRVSQLVESCDSHGVKWPDLHKQIKLIYKANNKICKSPKKAKKKKATNPVVGQPIPQVSDQVLGDNQNDANRPPIVLKIPNPTANRTSDDNNYDILSYFNQFMSSSSSPSPPASNQIPQSPASPLAQPNQVNDYSNRDGPSTMPSTQANGFMPPNQVHIPTISPFYNQRPVFNPLLPNGVQPPSTSLNFRPPLPPPALVRPPALGPFGQSGVYPPDYTQHMNFPYFHPNFFQSSQNTSQSYNQQNYYQNAIQSPDPDIFNPPNLDVLIKQQKFLLSQYTSPAKQNNTDDTDDNDTDDDDHPIGHNFVFKSLQTFTTIKTLLQAKSIGSLTDIGLNVDFTLNLVDLEANEFCFDLQSLLQQKSYQIQLRFTYISDVQIKEQKDSTPEFLCIECNNNRVFTSNEFDETSTCGPFDLSQWCKLGVNKVRFWMAKEKYTFLMPCLYEVSIVSFETPQTFLSKLKLNKAQYLDSQVTRQLIKSRSEQPTQDDIISITNTPTKVQLICPLSCKRIETPCRAVDCKHIECFDAFSFFNTNNMRYDWLCPICQKSSNYTQLRIDGYFSEILSNTEESVTEVFIQSDATYDLTNVTISAPVYDLDDSYDSSEIEVIDNSPIVQTVDEYGCITID